MITFTKAPTRTQEKAHDFIHFRAFGAVLHKVGLTMDDFVEQKEKDGKGKPLFFPKSPLTLIYTENKFNPPEISVYTIHGISENYIACTRTISKPRFLHPPVREAKSVSLTTKAIDWTFVEGTWSIKTE